MNQSDSTISNGQLSKNDIEYINKVLTKKGRSLLITLYRYQPLKHKDLADALDIKSTGLTNLISKINTSYEDFILSKREGRCKYHSLSPIAKIYAESVLLPKETAKKEISTSLVYNDSLLNNVLDSLKKLKEIEGENWDITLDELLYLETKHIPASNADSNKEIYNKRITIRDETYQKYTDFKNALISLVTQHGKNSAERIYNILNQNILHKQLDALLLNILDDFYKMEPLFRLETENLQAAYSVIDKIFTELFPKIFGANSVLHPDPLPPEYYSIHSVVIKMESEFRDSNGDKAAAIALWEEKFHTKSHFSCLSYIAEKCSTIYINSSRPLR